ncbi:MAG TPA: PD-(D/E)XK nuclease family protein [Woeseiaceae bacterium]|nr:PD-(D/E)XK nuclease family protein [Woeseiaceae bacterium]
MAAAGLAAAYRWLDDALAEGAEVVTAGRRLARELRQAYAERQLLAGRRAWHTPAVLPLDAWLETRLEAWPASDPLPQRLGAQASAVLWERCLERAAGLDRVDAAAFVPAARRAWRRLAEWNVDVDTLARAAVTGDEQRFARAAREYGRALAANGWLDAAGVAAQVAAGLDAGRVRAPARLVLAGFDRRTPALERLLEALERRGCRVSVPPERRAATPRVLEAADASAELRAAGAWARERLLENPAARVAIVYPGLEHDAARAARLVREGFVPGWQAGGSAHAEAVQVSHGRRLADYPLVARALSWLRWTTQPLGSREVGVLLRASFPGETAIDGSARLELELRRHPERRWSAAAVLALLAQRDDGPDAEEWLRRVARVAESRYADAGPDTPAAWTERMHALLDAVGWPGTRPLDSAEFQLVNRWRELLNELARIEPVRPRLGFGEALARLARAAADTPFQPESGPGQVQVLPPEEALGLEFDHLWVGNLHALQWPPPSHPLALVSRSLQRRAGMPDATPADTLAFARRVLSRLVASAPSVVLSWPAAEGDRPHAPSPLLPAAAAAAAAPVADPGWHAARLAGPAVSEAAADPVPRVQPDERIRGGARTVTRQRLDPFSAFAHGRLGVSELAPVTPGLPARRSGQIAHDALRRLLDGQPRSADLAGWTAAQRSARIAASLAAALKPHERHADAVLRRLLALEHARLTALLEAFLAAEIARRPFAVEGVERALTLVAHGVTLALRVDRLDRLGDDSLLVIDYKTGEEQPFLDRNGEPTDLQLVVYAAALAEPVGGLATVQLRPSGIRYRAVGASVEWSPLEPAAWQERLGEWKRQVAGTIEAFAAGDVRVNVARPPDEARPLSLLSRVEELRREA